MVVFALRPDEGKNNNDASLRKASSDRPSTNDTKAMMTPMPSHTFEASRDDFLRVQMQWSTWQFIFGHVVSTNKKEVILSMRAIILIRIRIRIIRYACSIKQLRSHDYPTIPRVISHPLRRFIFLVSHLQSLYFHSADADAGDGELRGDVARFLQLDFSSFSLKFRLICQG